jgi:hypothetical protein
MQNWLLTWYKRLSSGPINKTVQSGWLTHQGQFLGGTKSSAALKLQQDGCLIKLKEQVTENHTRWPSPDPINRLEWPNGPLGETAVWGSRMYLIGPDSCESWLVGWTPGWDL